MKRIWIARDKNGELWVYSNKPIRDEEIFIRPCSEHSMVSIKGDDDLFPEITWENSPVEFIENTKKEQYNDTKRKRTKLVKRRR